MHILRSLFEDIKDAYPEFDQNKYLTPVPSTASYDDEHSERALSLWVQKATTFLNNVMFDAICLSDNLFEDPYSEIVAKGFMQTLLKKISLDPFVMASKYCSDRVCNEIHSTSFMSFRTTRDDLISSATKATKVLLGVMRGLDYARIADRHLFIHKLGDATRKDESSAKEAVESAQEILDSNDSELTSKQQKELDQLLYSVAKKQGIVPSKLYISNVIRNGEYHFRGGAFGDVYLGQLGYQYVAVKVSRYFWDTEENERKHRELCKEALIWQRLHHRHILPFLGLCREGFPSTGLVSPFMQNGDALGYLKRNPHADKKQLTRQICSGLRYMHNNEPEVVHGDLKCANILIDDVGNARIADFGLARLIGIATSTPSGGGQGTLHWQAPELILPDTYGGEGRRNVKTDVYAFGMTCLEIFTGNVPFHDISVVEMIKMAESGTGLERALIVAQGSEHLVQILESCCSADPDSRMDMSGIDREIFKHVSPVVDHQDFCYYFYQ